MHWRWVSLAIALWACGGSSSETPWPVEPIDDNPGPEGEGFQKRNIIDVKKLPNTYNAGGASSVDEEDDPGDAGGSEPLD